MALSGCSYLYTSFVTLCMLLCGSSFIMDISRQKQSKKPVAKFPDISSGSDEGGEEEGDLFAKYGATPPVRSRSRGAQKKRVVLQKLPETSHLNATRTSQQYLEVPLASDQFLHQRTRSPTIVKSHQKEFSKQRESDRLMKWAYSAEGDALPANTPSSEEDECLTGMEPHHFQMHVKVESHNRFMSVCSRLIKKFPSQKMRTKKIGSLHNKQWIAHQSRTEFNDYFTALMKTGGVEKSSGNSSSSGKSEEEILWQTELQDLLWLELQAWISDRSPEEQDKHLFTRRQQIPAVLKRIAEYRFQPSCAVKKSFSDASVVTTHEEHTPGAGCLDAFCYVCALNQSKALHEVSALLKEVEGIEELYPSGRALAADHSLYGSSEFTQRLKAMCLWYNVTCLLQLKIDIIGHMFISLGTQGLPWPTWPAWPPVEDDKTNALNNASVRQSESASSVDSNIARRVGAARQKKPLKREKSRVQFFMENDAESNRAGMAEKHPLEGSPSESWKSDYSGPDLPEADVGLKHSFVPESQNQHSEQEAAPGNRVQTVRFDSVSTASESESDHGRVSGFETADGRLIYRSYIEKALKSKGLRKMLRWIVIIHRVSMVRAKEALKKPNQYKTSSCSSSPYLYEVEYAPANVRNIEQSELMDLQRYGTWSAEFHALNLPQYRTLYLFLCRIPLDVIRESLCIRLEQKPSEPSALSIRQLMQEFKEGIKVGVVCKQKYRRDVRAVLPIDDGETPQSLLENEFNEILQLTLSAYLDYLKRWVCMGTPNSQVQKNALEVEWNFVLSVCSEIPSGEMLAGNAFCSIASSMLKSTAQYLREGIRRRLEFHSDNSGSEGDAVREMAFSVLRRIQRVLQEARDQSLKAVAVTKMIRRDLEVAAEFDIRMPTADLLARLAKTGHVRVVVPHNDSYVVFVPHYLRDRKEYLHSLLDLSSRSQPFSTSDQDKGAPARNNYPQTDDSIENEGYMILLQASNGEDEAVDKQWKGETICVHTLRDDAILRSHVQSAVLLLIVFNAIHLPTRRLELQNMMGIGLELRHENRPSNHVVAESVLQLKTEVAGLSRTIINSINEVEEDFNVQRMMSGHQLDLLEKAPLVSRWKEVVRQCFKLGFEFHKDVLRLVTGKPDIGLARNIAELARQWMNFALAHCERGRGLRPKWAAQGLDFLVTACESDITCYLSEEEFGQMKELVAKCVCHVIGVRDHTSPKLQSPLLRRRSKISTPNMPTSLSNEAISASSPSPRMRRQSLPLWKEDSEKSTDEHLRRTPVPWRDRVRQSIQTIEAERNALLVEDNLIGRVARQNKEDAKWHIRLRSVHFSWQRGVKIGQGRFGKVYVAVNNQTGELMAMKEIALQPNDHRAIRSVADELRIFEGILHPHLVRYYGLEIHREEMIIFMEFCPEGTLENLASSTEAGLPEELIRRFTRQLLEAVVILHLHGIVHRDIKGANIFLADGGNCLKLGDFGCAAKIKSHTTVAGELQGFVGTQAFMAPEVFMHSMEEGHGRAADIWSVGCVVVEMSTGKRPWHELESNYAIMFKVGMGEVPPTPPTLSEEGQEFLSHLLQHDPKLRESAASLLEHTFLKVYQADETDNRR